MKKTKNEKIKQKTKRKLENNNEIKLYYITNNIK